MILMVELNHAIINVNADTLVKGSHGVVVSVHVSKVGASGAKVVLKNGTDANGVEEFTVFGEGIQNIQQINRRFENGIFADVTGAAEYVIVFK